LVKTPEVLVKNGIATFRQKREGFFAHRRDGLRNVAGGVAEERVGGVACHAVIARKRHFF
jgi:hypothetical protein